VLAALSVAGTACGQAPTTPAAPATNGGAPSSAPVAKLAVGDAAPTLAIAHWVKGDAVNRFEPGKVYVVEFWATWCAPCIANIPKLTALQDKFKDKGLVVIGVSSSDRRGVEDVRPFVERMGERMKYVVAVDDAFKTGASYMQAVGQNGIPYAFIVDQTGKLVWHGHPAEMEPIVERVISGDSAAMLEVARRQRLQALTDQIREAVLRKDWPSTDQAFDEIKRVDPASAGQMDVYRFLTILNDRADRPGAYAWAREIMGEKGSIRTDHRQLSAIAVNLARDPGLDEAGARVMTDAALAALNGTEQKNVDVLQVAAEAYWRASRPAVAVRLIDQAITLTSDMELRTRLSAARAKYQAPTGTVTPAQPAAP
jgi:thiol-disulfide isomerase/thioredoxin